MTTTGYYTNEPFSSSPYNLDCYVLLYSNKETNITDQYHATFTATAIYHLIRNNNNMDEPTPSMDQLRGINNLNKGLPLFYNTDDNEDPVASFDLNFTLPVINYTTFTILRHILLPSEFTIQEDDLTIDLSTQLQLTVDNYTSFRPDDSDDSGIDSKVTVTSKDITGDYYTAEVQCNSFYMIDDILYITVEYKLLNYDLNMATGGVRLERQVQFTISNKYYYSQTCQETIYINIEDR